MSRTTLVKADRSRDHLPAGYEVASKIEDRLNDARSLIVLLHYAQFGRSLAKASDDYAAAEAPADLDEWFDPSGRTVLEQIVKLLSDVLDLACVGLPQPESTDTKAASDGGTS